MGDVDKAILHIGRWTIVLDSIFHHRQYCSCAFPGSTATVDWRTRKCVWVGCLPVHTGHCLPKSRGNIWHRILDRFLVKHGAAHSTWYTLIDTSILTTIKYFH